MPSHENASVSLAYLMEYLELRGGSQRRRRRGFFGKFESRKRRFADFNPPGTKFSSRSAARNRPHVLSDLGRKKEREGRYASTDSNHFLVDGARNPCKNSDWIAIWLCRTCIHYNFKVATAASGKRLTVYRRRDARLVFPSACRPFVQHAHECYTREMWALQIPPFCITSWSGACYFYFEFQIINLKQ